MRHSMGAAMAVMTRSWQHPEGESNNQQRFRGYVFLQSSFLALFYTNSPVFAGGLIDSKLIANSYDVRCPQKETHLNV